MKEITIYAEFSPLNLKLEKIATLSQEGNLIYQDEQGYLKAQAITAGKFAMLTLTSPLIGVVRLVRSAVFILNGDPNRAGREFIGGVATPIMATGCLVGSLASLALSVLSEDKILLYVEMRRTYGFFEAWINQIKLDQEDLPGYSKRTSRFFHCVGSQEAKRIWTTAPCMQPVLEKGRAVEGGLLDASRMRKIFPGLKIKSVFEEEGQIVLESEYKDKNSHYCLLGGACERVRISQTCCCCFRVEGAYDRIFCCEVGSVNCSSIFNATQLCGMSFCSLCGLGVCLCHLPIDDLEIEA